MNSEKYVVAYLKNKEKTQTNPDSALLTVVVVFQHCKNAVISLSSC